MKNHTTHAGDKTMKAEKKWKGSSHHHPQEGKVLSKKGERRSKKSAAASWSALPCQRESAHKWPESPWPVRRNLCANNKQEQSQDRARNALKREGSE